MKTIKVKVCACTHCILNGAMDIVESIESLSLLKNEIRLNAKIEIIANECLCDSVNKGQSPLVVLDNELIEKATSEIVTAKIISSITKG
ncbi:NAD(P)H-dependent oxidoreductase subunit E [Paludicola sp. MB14-C6]|uniref:NAD(P)H-dependent oxidoreductase subunit E n=1 Tax=Paludihabitans sp. MB14-C6 TaxID=3070656 RepID=UPI0027DC226A|nr:NAD(P)H-dependent oxidoreductase subunit E [Paludicola sp. MB14-C6]WMJ22187.1 NAD(P)H-dependent oxidoreductase subunit E [Paludicola sp. MB14-C6]